MTHEETVKLLTLIKGNWYRQPTDDLTIAMWQSILGEHMQLDDVWPTALNMIRGGREEPPTPGELFVWARPIMNARIDHEREKVLRLGGQVMTYAPGERRVTPSGTVYIADENGILRPETA